MMTLSRPRRALRLAILLTVFLVIPALAVMFLLFAIDRAAADIGAPQPSKMVSVDQAPGGFILIVEDKGGNAKPDSPMYLGCNWSGWDPGDTRFKLEAQSDMRWRIVFDKPLSDARLAFKITRGSWETVECKPDLTDIDNRTLPEIDLATLKPGEKPKVEIIVEQWADEREDAKAKAAADPYRPIEVTGDVRRLQFIGGTGGAQGAFRDCLVWLPPGYDDAANAARTYPVLYMFDGQNLFAKHSGIAHEWNVDETLTRLISEKKIEPIVVVGIPHAGPKRTSEYLTVPIIPGAEVGGPGFVEVLITRIKPRVERAFRVRTDPADVAVGGASLGGAMAIETAARHPEAFGLVLCESLPLRAGPAQAWDRWLDGVSTWPKRMFIGMGGLETGGDSKNAERNRGYVEGAQQLDTRLASAGLGSDRRLLVIDEKAEHNEKAWSERFEQAVTFLFKE